MSSDYQKLPIKRYPRVAGRKTAESRYWRKFKSPILIKDYAAITHIHFSPVSPHDFAVTSSTRVQVYSSSTHTVKKTISRFTDVAYSAHIRNDGKLLVAGDATGTIQVFDLNSRAILRTMKGHTDPIHVTQFSSNQTQILSAADDKTVRIWDVPSESPVVVFDDQFQDYVRSAVVSASNPNLVLAGSYDHTVKLFDLRANECVMSMTHDSSPVESVLLFPGDGLAVSAGGNTLKIWDLVGGGRVVNSLSNHQKTITSLALDASCTRLLTGSLDHHVKVYDVQNYKVAHSIKYPAPILSVALSPDDSHICVGMANGLLSIKQRLQRTSEIASSLDSDSQLRSGTYKYFLRGANAHADTEDVRVGGNTNGKRGKSTKLQLYDKYLKGFQYGNALDAVLSSNQTPVAIMTVLEELVHRDGLQAALSGRTQATLDPLLRFLLKHITSPRYAPLLLDVANRVLDLYLDTPALTPDMCERLRSKVLQEVQVQKKLMGLLGTLDMVFANAVRNNSANEEVVSR